LDVEAGEDRCDEAGDDGDVNGSIGGFAEGEKGVVIVKQSDNDVLVVGGVVGKVRDSDVEIVLVVDDLKGEGNVIETVDGNLSTMAKVCGYVGSSRSEIASDTIVKDDVDPRGVAGIGGNGSK
jgi:hypothetical protein